MKTKLTLTINKKIIDSAKKMARKRNMSLSQLFEEIFGQENINSIESESQRAARKLLAKLSLSESIKTKNDKGLLKSHVAGKYA